ncbi:hypothetical protein Tco_1246716 [Tanacetum coccineum]
MAEKGNHGQGEAALPVAIKRFLIENEHVAGILVILEIQTSSKSKAEVNQRDSRQGVQTYGTVRQRDEDRFREIAMLSGSARVVLDKNDILKDASEIKQTGVNGVVEIANFGEASLQTNVNGMEHEKLSSSSSLTSSSWTDLSLKMKEVGPDGEKQSKEAKDKDVQHQQQIQCCRIHLDGFLTANATFFVEIKRMPMIAPTVVYVALRSMQQLLTLPGSVTSPTDFPFAANWQELGTITQLVSQSIE